MLYPSEKREALEAIPGLTVGYDIVTGWPDAIEAACRVLGTSWALPPLKALIHVLPTDLAPHQVDGVNNLWAIMRKYGGAYLADDMGGGKTRTVLELAKLVTGRTVVVARASVRETWREEILKWWPDVKYHVAEPKKREPPPDTKLLIVSQDDFARGYEPPYYADFLVIEEAHQMRGRDTKRAKSMQTYANMCTWRLLLSGTPVPNLPRDLWFPLSLAFGSAFGSGFQFNLRYAGARLNEHGAWIANGASNLDELRARLAHYMVRRTKQEMGLDLPPLARKVNWVDGSPAASEAFKQAVLTKSARLRQRALEATMAGKYDEVVRLAVEARSPVVVMTWRHVDVARLVTKLEEADVRCLAIEGSIPPKKRQALIRRAERERLSVVATIDSIETGVNMQNVARVGIMHKLDDVPLKMAQAEARIHRWGSSDEVTWHYIAMRDSIDGPIVDRIINKMDFLRNLIGRDENTRLRDTLQDAKAEGLNDEELAKSIYDSLGE